MVQVKDLTELTIEDLWREVKGDDEDWWGDLKQETLRMVKRLLESPSGEGWKRNCWNACGWDAIECTLMVGQVGLVLPRKDGGVAQSLAEQAETLQTHSVGDNQEPNEASSDYRPPQ